MHKIEVNESILNKIFDNIKLGAILTDFNLNILFINPKAIQLLELDNLNYTHKSLYSLFPLFIKEKINPILSQVLTSKIEVTHNIDINIGNESNLIPRILRIFISSFILEVSIINITIHDISSEQNIEILKKNLIRNISHELKSPLFNIQSILETLIDYYDNLEKNEQIEFLNIANQEILRLTRLVNKTLDLSKIEKLNEFKNETININTIIQQLLNTYQFVAKTKHIEFYLEIDKIHLIEGNPDLLFQVMSNLIDNAIKFTAHSGQIVIRVFTYQHNIKYNRRFFHQIKNKTTLRIEVSDNGIGMVPAKKLSLIETLSNPKSNFYTFPGLGLSIAQNILGKYSTRIYFRSINLVGTTFWFDLF
uniref:two component sensor kinase n=1 Tax=Stylonema alsidii TaxID=35155 RepID=UPI001FCDE181|nr:two component sensor kinase [Stylonema alsidii]UNJ15116.1 two component sensor kinase [Stylonema alsidii]